MDIEKTASVHDDTTQVELPGQLPDDPVVETVELGITTLKEDTLQETTYAFLHSRRLVLIALILVYAAFYFVRSHAAVTLPKILNSTGLTKSQFGIIYSFGLGAQAIGKLANGYLADNKGGKVVLLASLYGSIVASAIFALIGYIHSNVRALETTGLLIYFIVLWTFNRFFQSAAWGAIMKILPYWIEEKEYGRITSLFSLSYGFGDAVVRILLGTLVALPNLNWFDVWWVACAISFAMGLPGFWMIKARPGVQTKVISTRVKETNAVEKKNLAAKEDQESAWHSIRRLFKMFDFWIVIFLYMGLTLIRETFSSWTTQFLTERLNLTESSAAIASLLIPLFAALSAMSGGWIFDLTPQKYKELVSVFYLAYSLVALAALTLCSFLKYDSVLVNLFLLASVSFGMEAPYTLIDGAYTLKISGKKSPGLTVGIIQAAGYSGAIASGYFTGIVAELYGWATMMAILSGIMSLLFGLTVLSYITTSLKKGGH